MVVGRCPKDEVGTRLFKVVSDKGVELRRVRCIRQCRKPAEYLFRLEFSADGRVDENLAVCVHKRRRRM